MVYLPNDGVLIAGDILVNTLMPNFRDAHVAAWIDTLEWITELPLSVIVPGHGALMHVYDAKRMQREMAQRRMMAEVPKADVVITNPEHYSVALRYQPDKMNATPSVGTSSVPTYKTLFIGVAHLSGGFEGADEDVCRPQHHGADHSSISIPTPRYNAPPMAETVNCCE